MGTKPQNVLQLYTTSECHTLMLWENIKAVSEERHTIFVPEVKQKGCPTLRAHFYLLDYYMAMYFHALQPLNILIWTKYLFIYSLTKIFILLMFIEYLCVLDTALGTKGKILRKCGKEEKYSHCVLVFSILVVRWTIKNKKEEKKIKKHQIWKGKSEESDWWEIWVSVCKAGDLGSIPVLEKFPWRRAWQPTPVSLPGESLWTEEPGRLQSMGSQRVGHDWTTKHMSFFSLGCSNRPHWAVRWHVLETSSLKRQVRRFLILEEQLVDGPWAGKEWFRKEQESLMAGSKHTGREEKKWLLGRSEMIHSPQ